MQCNATQRNAMQRNAMQRNAIQTQRNATISPRSTFARPCRRRSPCACAGSPARDERARPAFLFVTRTPAARRGIAAPSLSLGRQAWRNRKQNTARATTTTRLRVELDVAFSLVPDIAASQRGVTVTRTRPFASTRPSGARVSCAVVCGGTRAQPATFVVAAVVSSPAAAAPPPRHRDHARTTMPVAAGRDMTQDHRHRRLDGRADGARSARPRPRRLAGRTEGK